jgi:hypothetical protein
VSGAGSAELITDGGAAASGDDFFRSPEFLAAEGTTHTLRIAAAGEGIVAPLIVREDLPGDHRDAISPYGYPGVASISKAAAAGGSGEPGQMVDPAAIGFDATGLVSVFIRHALGEPPLAGATERNPVLLADPAQPRKSRMSDRQQVRRNERAGYEVRIVPGPETSAEERAAFHAAYTETMVRADAAERYMYEPAYFDVILAAAATWLAIATTGEGEPAAASILARSDGVLHYHLSGTGDAHLSDSPMKTVVFALIDFAEEQEMPLNLGGGVTPGDPLEEFKRGFANREERLFTSEVVCDSEAYAELSEGIDAGGFFPAYRAPG